MSATLNKLGDEFAHPTDGRPVRVVRMSSGVWGSAAEECDHCCMEAECRGDFGSGAHGCGMAGGDFVAYVDRIPYLMMKGILA